MQHPAEREADRLRVIISTLAYTNPTMTMDEAEDVIFKIEKETAKLEAQQVEASTLFPLPDDSPATISKFIDLCPDIQKEINDGKMINGIKSLRARCTIDGRAVGLKEAKEGVELWRDHGTRPVSPASSVTPPPSYPTPLALADWIEHNSFLTDVYDRGGPSGRILLTKEVRRYSGLGLKDALNGVDAWIGKYR